MREQCRDSAYGLSVKLDLENGLIVYMCGHLLVMTAYTFYTYCCFVTLTNSIAKATCVICGINNVLLAPAKLLCV